MALRPFRVVRPASAAEASAELARLGERAAVYCGGVELVLLNRLGFVDADHFVDVKRIPGLREIGGDGAGLRIGAAATHRRVHEDALVRERLPLLARACSKVGNVRIRNQGTLGGNVCFSDPHSDPTTPLLVYDAAVVAESMRGVRELPVDAFVRGPYDTALEPDEVVTSIRATPLDGFGQSYLRVERFDRPTLNVSAAVRRTNGSIAEARLAVGSVGPRPRRLVGLEARVAGATPEEADRLLAESRAELAEALEPSTDLLGSRDYKLHLAVVLLRRALAAAAEPVAGGAAK